MQVDKNIFNNQQLNQTVYVVTTTTRPTAKEQRYIAQPQRNVAQAEHVNKRENGDVVAREGACGKEKRGSIHPSAMKRGFRFQVAFRRNDGSEHGSGGSSDRADVQ